MISKAGDPVMPLFHWSCACWPTDGSQEDGEAKDEEMKEEEVKRALIKSIAKGFRKETIINSMFKRFFSYKDSEVFRIQNFSTGM